MRKYVSLATQLSILEHSGVWKFPHRMAQHPLTALSVELLHVAYGISQ